MELTDLAASFSLNKICRLCMGKDLTFIPLFVQDDSLSQKIQAIVPLLKLCQDDGLPAQICSQCVNQVYTSYNFKLQCETSEFTMRRLLDFQNNQNENSGDAVVKEESEDCDIISGDVEISKEIESCIIIKPEIPSADLLNIKSKKDSTVKKDPINEQESKTMKIRNIPKKRKYVSFISPNHILKEIEKRFSTLEQVSCHMQTHSDQRVFHVSFLEKFLFCKESSFHIHYRLHPAEKPFTCGKCGDKFSNHFALKKHKKSI